MTTVTRPDTLLPDPVPGAVRSTVISFDDHLVEPPDMTQHNAARLYRWPLPDDPVP